MEGDGKMKIKTRYSRIVVKEFEKNLWNWKGTCEEILDMLSDNMVSKKIKAVMEKHHMELINADRKTRKRIEVRER